jgi:hypothetical protein
MSDDDTFALLLARLHASEDATAQHVFELFAGGLVALVRRGFNQLLARKVDSEDDVSRPLAATAADIDRARRLSVR